MVLCCDRRVSLDRFCCVAKLWHWNIVHKLPCGWLNKFFTSPAENNYILLITQFQQSWLIHKSINALLHSKTKSQLLEKTKTFIFGLKLHSQLITPNNNQRRSRIRSQLYRKKHQPKNKISHKIPSNVSISKEFLDAKPKNNNNFW